MTVTVQQSFNNVPQAGIGSATFSNAYGTGNHIVSTSRLCGAGWWRQKVTVTIAGIGTYAPIVTPNAWVQTACTG